MISYLGAKIIIFCQFRRLANIIFQTLEKNGVKVVRVHGNFAMRQKSISLYKSDPKCSIIMLSTEDSVSGLHLPESKRYFINPSYSYLCNTSFLLWYRTTDG